MYTLQHSNKTMNIGLTKLINLNNNFKEAVLNLILWCIVGTLNFLNVENYVTGTTPSSGSGAGDIRIWSDDHVTELVKMKMVCDVLMVIQTVSDI
jgi:hypothetical protein